MSARKTRDPAARAPAEQQEDSVELQGSGTGAASALERMKAEHALRHRRQHGARTAGAGHEDDRTPQR